MAEEDEKKGDETSYEIIVKNESESNLSLTLFQTNDYNDSNGFFPLVWNQAGIADQGKGTFSWKLQWGISWTQKAQGFYERGPIISRDPTDSAKNAVTISYNKDVSVWDIKPANHEKIPIGFLGIY